MEILRDAGLSALIASDRLETLADGFEFTEGPLWLPDGSILFQDIKAERTYRLGPDRKVQVLREHTGAANGQTFAADGGIVFCEQTGRRLSWMSIRSPEPVALALDWQGKRLNSPNDVVCRSDGSAYFTDPPYGVKPEDREIEFQGVFRWTADLGPVKLLEDFEKPNGLAFTPDERTLYVCDTGRYHVRAFRVREDGDLEPGVGRIFATLDPDQAGGPDGIKVDRAGRVYVAVALGVWVFEPDGRLLGILATPKRPSNLNWCDADACGLVITAVDAVHYVRFHEPGLPPVFLPRE
ncbi:SMP-30/gluconolactonase/LRE family protein [Paludisphaera mucosa]|uniref:SMP-30/gluconolactonase/LRE family protein n=1 Tax=Paludisphaera mucosa TaxID=3030827 RepID=A0ABT6F8L0_9BACT|nr:SMP-30/gluconolactonase/LRE family protein [Paludisphaera mucosa]MDG3003769.1 SMP-30/gluconolactonase/LRE family protein [Paludisphaera mucosa]